MRRSAYSSLVAFYLLATVGCSDGVDNTSIETFIGTWKYSSATNTTVCAGDSETSPLTGSFQVDRGTSSDLVVVDPECPIKLDISNNVATAQAGQTCTQRRDEQTTINLTFTSWVFTSTGEMTMTEFGTAKANVTAGGQTIPCSMTVTGELAKL
jgi:hypothetical protein